MILFVDNLYPDCWLQIAKNIIFMCSRFCSIYDVMGNEKKTGTTTTTTTIEKREIHILTTNWLAEEIKSKIRNRKNLLNVQSFFFRAQSVLEEEPIL